MVNQIKQTEILNPIYPSGISPMQDEMKKIEAEDRMNKQNVFNTMYANIDMSRGQSSSDFINTSLD